MQVFHCGKPALQDGTALQRDQLLTAEDQPRFKPNLIKEDMDSGKYSAERGMFTVLAILV